jgi:hypothetical protein
MIAVFVVVSTFAEHFSVVSKHAADGGVRRSQADSFACER